VVVHFVDIDGIVDHICHCLFVLNGLRWEVVVHFVDICGIVDHICRCLFVLNGLRCRGACAICWYFWNCWPSLFKFSIYRNNT